VPLVAAGVRVYKDWTGLAKARVRYRAETDKDIERMKGDIERYLESHGNTTPGWVGFVPPPVTGAYHLARCMESIYTNANEWTADAAIDCHAFYIGTFSDETFLLLSWLYAERILNQPSFDPNVVKRRMCGNLRDTTRRLCRSYFLRHGHLIRYAKCNFIDAVRWIPMSVT
jgi:hypothetical protein